MNLRSLKGLFFGVLFLITSASFIPFLYLFVSILIANAAGCRATSGFLKDPCLFAGLDIKDFLNLGFVMGWIAIPAFPIMILSIFAWIFVLIVRAKPDKSAR